MVGENETGSIRRIQKVWRSQPTLEGAGVHLRRAFGFHEVPQLDPFLLLDDFRSENPEDYKLEFHSVVAANLLSWEKRIVNNDPGEV